MNNDSFLRHIENSRDCEQDRLDKAVNLGLRRAMDDRLSFNKLLMLAASCLITFAISAVLYLTPLKISIDEYNLNKHKTMSNNMEILGGYISDITNNFLRNPEGD